MYNVVKHYFNMTGRGYVAKALVFDKYNNLYIARGNSHYNNICGLEPYSDYIVSKICDILKYANISYNLVNASEAPNVPVYSIKHVSLSNCSQCSNSNTSLYALMSGLNNYNLHDFKEYSFYEKVKALLLLDIFICNEERTLDSIKIFHKEDGDIDLFPVSAFGSSLYGWCKDEDLHIERYPSNPFGIQPERQMKYLGETQVPFTKDDITVLRKELPSIIYNTPFISSYRAESILNFLESRMWMLEERC